MSKTPKTKAKKKGVQRLKTLSKRRIRSRLVPTSRQTSEGPLPPRRARIGHRLTVRTRPPLHGEEGIKRRQKGSDVWRRHSEREKAFKLASRLIPEDAVMPTNPLLTKKVTGLSWIKRLNGGWGQFCEHPCDQTFVLPDLADQYGAERRSLGHIGKSSDAGVSASIARFLFNLDNETSDAASGPSGTLEP